MLRRLARAAAFGVSASMATTIVVILAFQAILGRWSLHTLLDLGAVMTVVAAMAILVCVLAFALFHRTSVLATRARAASAAAAVASVAGTAAAAWFLADGDPYPATLGQWFSAFAHPLTATYAIAGGAFGCSWNQPRAQEA
jgi:hypothetical protein